MTLRRSGLFRSFPPIYTEGDDGGGGGAGSGGEGGSGDGGAAANAAANAAMNAVLSTGAAGLPEGAQAPADAGDGGKDGDGEDEFKPLTVEEQKALVKKHNDAQAKLRQEKAAKDEAERKRKEKAGEHEDLAKAERERADKLAGKVKTSALRSAIKDAAGTGDTKFSDPALALRLIDTADLDVEFDEEEGEATIPKATEAAIKKRLAALLKSTPGLAAGAAGGGGGSRARQLPGAGNTQGGSSGASDMNAAIRRAAGR